MRRTRGTPAKQGWMVVYRPDTEVNLAGEDEVFEIIYTKLKRAKEECAEYLKTVMEDSEMRIDWFEDSSSVPARRVYCGRPDLRVDALFYLYEMKVEL